MLSCGRVSGFLPEIVEQEIFSLKNPALGFLQLALLLPARWSPSKPEGHCHSSSLGGPWFHLVTFSHLHTKKLSINSSCMWTCQDPLPFYPSLTLCNTFFYSFIYLFLLVFFCFVLLCFLRKQKRVWVVSGKMFPKLNSLEHW